MIKQKPKQKEKLFVIRKYIKARSATEAIKKEKTHPVDDVWIDADWQKMNMFDKETELGFTSAKR